jgi:hypothetical protein
VRSIPFVIVGSLMAWIPLCGCARDKDALDFGAARATTSPVPSTQALPPATTDGRTSSPSAVGTNLGELRDWGADRPFVDVFKQSRAWISTTGETWDDGRPLDVDVAGYVKRLLPGQFARSLVFWGEPVDFPAGAYAVEWDGTGEVDFWPQSSATSTSKGRGSYLLQADPARGGLAITIRRTDPQDPVRNLRVYAPGMDRLARFNPTFLARLRGYTTLRFMDWMNTNEGASMDANTRPRESDARYTTRGVPVEVIAALCNELRTDCWINVGHTWDDKLIDVVAEVLRDNLDPRLRLYVEHANEVWNGIFPVASWAQERGLAARLATDPFEAQLRFHARRSAHVHARFERVFAAKTAGHRPSFVRVLGGWAANSWSTDVMLDQMKKDGAAVDVVAIAPYFGGALGEPQALGTVRAMSLENLLAHLEKDVDDALATVREQKAVTMKNGVGLVAYEGGQHLTGIGAVAEDEVVNRLFDEANVHPRMKALYLRYLEGWQSAGGGVFVHYTSTQRPSRYGRWGALTSMTQTRAEAPKYDALMTFIERSAPAPAPAP